MTFASAHIDLFIRDRLPVTPVPGIPEIRLHKASPTSGLWRLAAQDEQGFGPPYWAHHWAGGMALARYVLDNPQVVSGRRILDLGAGSGLVAIAAAKSGAHKVMAAEIDPYAVAALNLNVRLNEVSVSIVHDNLTERALPDVEVILVGDLFYTAELSERITGFLDRCLDRGMRVIVGDPWRKYLPTERLVEMARYLVTEGGSHTTKASGVFEFGA